MHAQLEKLSGTQVKLTITAAEDDLLVYKNQAVKKLSASVKLPGFRKGTAPPALVEKNIDQQMLQTEFLDRAMSGLYAAAAQNEHIRPVTQPDVTVKKFVPFSVLEFDVKTHVIDKITLPSYKTIKLKKDEASVNADDVSNVLDSLQTRMAEKKEVQRAAKSGDQAWIDFAGVDAKGGPVQGADGKDYPLNLGSKTFIPGFEENIEGMKPGDEKAFALTFPSDYGVKALANKQVTFTVTLKKVEEVIKPKVDDELAKKIGPFKNVADLKADIKKQLKVEKQREIDGKFQAELVGKIVDKTDLAIPQPMLEEQASRELEEVRRNLNYRGQTYPEFLEMGGFTEESHMETVLKPQAERQVKTGLILNEIADAEQLSVTPEELEIRIQLLKGQYQDSSMQSELDKPENRRDVAGRMLNEKVLACLEEYSQM